MKYSHLLSRTIALGALTLVGAGSAYAQATTPIYLGTTGAAGNVTYNYQLQLGSDTRIQSGDKFTFYDFDGLLTGGANDPSFVGVGGASYLLATPALGDNPPGTLQLAGDSPSLANVSLTYNGPTIANNTAGVVVLGTLSVHSANTVNLAGDFTSFAANDTKDSNSTPAGNQGFVTGPNASTTPEPGAWAMFVGMGVSGAAFVRRRNRRK